MLGNKCWHKGDLVYIPQGGVLFDHSDLGYVRTYRPEIGVILEQISNRPFPDRYTVFCMGRTFIAHSNQIHDVEYKKENVHVD